MKKLAILTLLLLTLYSAAFAETNKSDEQNAQNSSYTESNADCKDGVCKWKK